MSNKYLKYIRYQHFLSIALKLRVCWTDLNVGFLNPSPIRVSSKQHLHPTSMYFKYMDAAGFSCWLKKELNLIGKFQVYEIPNLISCIVLQPCPVIIHPLIPGMEWLQPDVPGSPEPVMWQPQPDFETTSLEVRGSCINPLVLLHF